MNTPPVAEWYHDRGCPECGGREFDEWLDGVMLVVSCSNCGLTVSDSYAGDDAEAEVGAAARTTTT